VAKRDVSFPPRLVIILNRFVIGGQAVDTIPLAWHLQNDFQILIVYGEKEKDEIEPVFLLQQYPGLRLKKVKSLRRNINPFNEVFAFLSILFIIITETPDMVHTHGAKSGFIGRIAAWMARVPVIVHTFHGHFFHSYFSKKISNVVAVVERLVGKITTKAIALSEGQKTELSAVYKILPAAKIEIIHLGFGFDQPNNTEILREEFRRRYGLQPDDVAIGIVGRVVAVKNHRFFVEVIQKMLDAPTVNSPAFFIVGDGELRHQVQEYLQQKRIPYNFEGISGNNRVIFTSWTTDMYKVMNGLDIIVLTSFNEGTPLSIIEAEFFRRPVVSTNVGGVKDTMVDNETGFLVEADDLATFVDKLRLLVENKELREQMGENGYKFASQKFCKKKEIELTKDFYFSLLKQKGYPFGQNWKYKQK
jgi:glycosyltransferase involved in cell wall biosynthesis